MTVCKLRSITPLVALAAVLLLLVTALYAQPPAAANRGMAKLDIEGKDFSINYGRPKMNGRDFSSTAVGTIWRMGMNQATTITLPVEIYTCCGVIKAGNYSLWAKKVDPDKKTGAEKWELIFNSQTGQWGTNHDPLKDVLSVPMKVEAAAESVEQLAISIEKAAKGYEIRTAWGTKVLVMEFTTKP
jgi:hypothetical protein